MKYLKNILILFAASSPTSDPTANYITSSTGGQKSESYRVRSICRNNETPPVHVFKETPV